MITAYCCVLVWICCGMTCTICDWFCIPTVYRLLPTLISYILPISIQFKPQKGALQEKGSWFRGPAFLFTPHFKYGISYLYFWIVQKQGRGKSCETCRVLLFLAIPLPAAGMGSKENQSLCPAGEGLVCIATALKPSSSLIL